MNTEDIIVVSGKLFVFPPDKENIFKKTEFSLCGEYPYYGKYYPVIYKHSMLTVDLLLSTGKEIPIKTKNTGQFLRKLRITNKNKEHEKLIEIWKAQKKI